MDSKVVDSFLWLVVILLTSMGEAGLREVVSRSPPVETPARLATRALCIFTPLLGAYVGARPTLSPDRYLLNLVLVRFTLETRLLHMCAVFVCLSVCVRVFVRAL